MHDPMVVAFEIRRPWPKRSKPDPKPGQSRWEWRRHGPWWRPGSWSPFVTAFGRRWYFPGVITVWHVEPKGHDSGSICKHHDRWQDEDGKWHSKTRNGWRWHVHHWHIQVSPLQRIRKRLFDRCAECGRKGSPNVSHQWDGPGVGWRKWRSRQGIYHSECSSLVSLRRQRATDERLIGHLFAAYRVAADMGEAEALANLTDPKRRSIEFGDAYRLTGILGYDRDDSYSLVKKADNGPTKVAAESPRNGSPSEDDRG